VVWSIIPDTQEAVDTQRQEDHKFKTNPGKSSNETLSQKQNKNKRAKGKAHMVEYLPSMWEALGSNLSTKKEKTIVWGADYEKPMRTLQKHSCAQ
jgi:hypothetical protein